MSALRHLPIGHEYPSDIGPVGRRKLQKDGSDRSNRSVWRNGPDQDGLR